MIKRVRSVFVMLCMGMLLCSCTLSQKAESDTKTEQSSESSDKTEKSDTKKQGENQDNGNVQNENIINNGAYFVKIGSDIYFRKYGEYALEKNALFGEFLEYPTFTGISWICRLREDGKVEELFKDSGYGKLYYSNQRFYLSEMTDDGTSKSYSVNMEGEDRKELGAGAILGISENGQYLAKGDWNSAVVIDLSSKETPYIWASEEGSPVVFLGFVNDGFLIEGDNYSTDGYNVTSRQIFGRSFDKPDENIIVGDLSENKESYSSPEFKRLTMDGKDFYLTFGYYGGTGHFLENVEIYKARLEENSLELISQDTGIQEETAPNIPLIFANNGKIDILAGGSDGELDIDEGSVYKIDRKGRQPLISDLFKVDPNSQTGQSIGKAELVDGDLLLMVFTQIYTPYQDVGWRMSYSRLNTEYIVVRKGSNKPKVFEQWSDSEFKQNAEVWKTGENTLLYRPLPDNPTESELSTDIVYSVPIPESVKYNFSVQISSPQKDEYGEFKLPDTEGEKLQLIFDHTGALRDIVKE
ncbi:hypothetical protein HMPREF9970_1816 [Lachnoanaerobaculum saburreum F0468]|uniref:Lipoprotein n=1 Tax=Lachnoanaerobaculum saburreum F0468 TaxID=1095750 RepID=I0RBW9_9FIRM|nr:hypothetical protein [Lachnoanaerobaculum saburreum]EIC97177.1 hypothetical protein HMPREF9970_1816 [Lachnoanaerobaculum saburreum F0468]